MSSSTPTREPAQRQLWSLKTKAVPASSRRRTRSSAAATAWKSPSSKLAFRNTKPVLLKAATDAEWASKEFGATADVPINVTPNGRTLEWELSTAAFVKKIGPPGETYPSPLITTDATGHAACIGSTTTTGKAVLKVKDVELGDCCAATKDVYVLKLDVTKVPPYLFANAKYATPIKFSVLGATPNVLKLKKVRVSYVQNWIYQAGNQGKTVHVDGVELSTRTDILDGPNANRAWKNTDGKGTEFESFLSSTAFSTVIFGSDDGSSKNTHFELEAEVDIGGGSVIKLKSDIDDADARVIEAWDITTDVLDLRTRALDTGTYHRVADGVDNNDRGEERVTETAVPSQTLVGSLVI